MFGFEIENAQTLYQELDLHDRKEQQSKQLKRKKTEQHWLLNEEEPTIKRNIALRQKQSETRRFDNDVTSPSQYWDSIDEPSSFLDSKLMASDLNLKPR